MRFLSLVLVMYFLKLGRVCWCAGKPNVLSINLSEGSNVNSIDIAKDPGPNVAEVNNEKDNGVDGKKFNVKDSVKITLVLDNGIQIWNGGGDKNCTVIAVL
ncbi:signal peptide containing protein [Theileria equi strain WA]|uniref:Signal peptide containing protein n=1 Tax=Theileria equi strain WA TaxID=1537102 RepID=L1LC97_THEEQ|nr:signal peptide containing protein [Theileria equi strain WA]EKX72875.1 signal peptide containing protein [Theileria equi strain WA]|eukprot:XP_004832327.1 signal peptide containing protein [Theileria equi strain WA]